jgi:hypothetical protein
MGFSEDFLSHIRMARDLSRQQRAADVAKTTGETEKMFAMTPFEQGLMSAQAQSASGSAAASMASAGLSQAQASRVSALTPYEIAEMRAQTGLLGAQSGKLFAETATEWGMTPSGMANVGLTQAQAEKLRAEAASEYGYTAPARANINLTNAQAGKYTADTAETYGYTAPARANINLTNAQSGKYMADTAETYGYTAPAQANINLTNAQAGKYMADTTKPYGVPNFSNAMAGSTYFGGGPQITSSIIAPPTSLKKRLVTYANGARGWQYYS